MTEAEWLGCGDPAELEDALEAMMQSRPSDRKYRLYGCACVRRVWRELPDDTLRTAIEICERYADGLAMAGELAAACKMAGDAYRGIGNILVDHSTLAVEALCQPVPWLMTGEGSSAGITAAEAVALHDEVPYHVGVERARQACAVLFREVFGNPFRLVCVPPVCLTPSVRSLAQAAYDVQYLPSGELDPTCLAVLSDALEEAGCTDDAILSHLRSPGPHVRGCWALDLVLGKQ